MSTKGSERGAFVVLEGIDGAGTTTQVARLSDRLKQRGRAVRATREPSDGPIGHMLRQFLGGRLVMPGGSPPSWNMMALLFAADRVDHVQAEILPFVARGGVVLSDRYDASSLAYQSVTSGTRGLDTLDWIRTLNRYAVRPDLTVVLDVPADSAARRRALRGDAEQIYEQNEVQVALAEFYRHLDAHMPNDRVVILDGTGSVEEVEERLAQAVSLALGFSLDNPDRKFG